MNKTCLAMRASELVRGNRRDIALACAAVVSWSWALLLIPPSLWSYLGVSLLVAAVAPVWLLWATVAGRSLRGASIFALVVCLCVATPFRLGVGQGSAGGGRPVDGAGMHVLLADGWIPVSFDLDNYDCTFIDAATCGVARGTAFGLVLLPGDPIPGPVNLHADPRGDWSSESQVTASGGRYWIAGERLHVLIWKVGLGYWAFMALLAAMIMWFRRQVAIESRRCA